MQLYILWWVLVAVVVLVVYWWYRAEIIQYLQQTQDSSLTIDPEDPPCLASSEKPSSKGETTCRATLEAMFHKPFPNVRPNWLKNPYTHRNLELDCYNEELKLAVEYNGIQHYFWPNFTGQTEQEFRDQVYRDNLKKELCQQHGVTLIVVPYNIQQELIPDYLQLRLQEASNK